MCDVSQRGTLVHCASGLIFWIKENIIKTFNFCWRNQSERGGGGRTVLMDNRFRLPYRCAHTYACLLARWYTVHTVYAESTIDVSCLFSANGVHFFPAQPQDGIAAEGLIMAWISWAAEFSGSGWDFVSETYKHPRAVGPLLRSFVFSVWKQSQGMLRAVVWLISFICERG